MHWQVILAFLLGATAGILVGAIPGMEPAGAMAIALPFSLTMEPFLASSSCSGAMAGRGMAGRFRRS